ncbi:hypothetical protein M0657_011376 [Pyricularia oryzae]|uniref:Uncharacterized protein n=2 Tax=Pyricularia TaxID=48558 RepID=A0A6P8BMF5_PYRGI|nr:uncharacterized protein PgNI_01106 [Pyricularia grisea]ELQ32497.1 hypothetical protein OOU_Y34scaffold01115g7 [Pyricularia oryzae Y34]KAI7910415.1 hypothetical protein M0657_011376 [Pyricularia oryzae]TLD17864.1 hypothetical protein PgNI_01106 [Pyricularia grisea]
MSSHTPAEDLLPAWISPLTTQDLHQRPFSTSNSTRSRDECELKILEIARGLQETNKDFPSEAITTSRLEERIGGAEAKAAIVEAKTKSWEETVSRLKEHYIRTENSSSSRATRGLWKELTSFHVEHSALRRQISSLEARLHILEETCGDNRLSAKKDYTQTTPRKNGGVDLSANQPDPQPRPLAGSTMASGKSGRQL